MAWVRSLPEPVSGEMEALYREMIALETPGGEALQGDGQAGSHRAAQRIGHCNMGAARVSAQHDVCGRRSRVVAVLRELREAIRNDTKAKIAAAEQQA